MKKTFNKIFSVTLVLVMLFAVITPANAAFTVTAEQWNAQWAANDGSAVKLAPGSDETQMNVSWFGAETDVVPYVYLKADGDTDYVAHGGSVETSEDFASAVYKVTLINLLPDTLYSYYCVSGSYISETYTFKTAPQGDFTAILVSDIHVSQSDENPDNIRDTAGIFNNILTEGVSRAPETSLILSAGDNADHGLYEEYVGVFANSLVKSIPFAPVCGNHDYKAEVYPVVINRPNIYNEQAFTADKNGGDYWFTQGNVLFLMLNGNWISSKDHRNFVDQAVAQNPDCKWRVAVMHQDLYGGHIPHRESENELMRTMFAPIFDEYNVDLVLMGHSHIYSRSHVLYDNAVVENVQGKSSVTDAKGTIYITTGSTSRPREDVGQGSTRVAFDYKSGTDYIYDIITFSEDSISFKAYAAEKDEPIDNFTIYKTTADGGHSDEAVNPFYDIVHFISMIASIFRTLGQMLGIG